MNAKMAMLTLSALIAAKASATQVETEVKVDSVNAVSKTQTEAKQKKLKSYESMSERELLIEIAKNTLKEVE